MEPSNAFMDFTPVPREKRHAPPRIRNINGRFYTHKWKEHREAYAFLQEMTELHGEGTKTVVRALNAWQDYLDAGEAKDGSRAPLQDFTPLPQKGGKGETKPSGIMVRLRIDAYLEHRRAADIIEEAIQIHGEGTKTIVRALIYFRDNFVRPLEAQARNRSGSRSDEQLRL
jgi:hypothetical protein